MKKNLLFVLLFLLSFIKLNAQSSSPGVAINSTDAPADPSAMLDVSSTSQGLLVPRMTTRQRLEIRPAANGLLVYDIEESQFFYYDGKAEPKLWVKAMGPAGSPGFTGPTGSAGATGGTGSIGVVGATGLPGVKGATGSIGASGVIGSTGPTGAIGRTGSTGNTGANGTAGQNAIDAYGTDPLKILQPIQIKGGNTPPGPWNLIWGLKQTITVPPNSVISLYTDGAIQTATPARTGFSAVDIAIFIDGVLSTEAAHKRVIAVNSPIVSPMIENYAMGKVVSLSAGLHTIEVKARWIAGADVNIGGNNTSVAQGVLKVIILKK